MGTMRQDLPSWSDPRTTEIEIGRALEASAAASTKLASKLPGAALGIAGASFVAALGLRLIGFDRAARWVAWLVPSVLAIAAMQELAKSGAAAR